MVHGECVYHAVRALLLKGGHPSDQDPNVSWSLQAPNHALTMTFNSRLRLFCREGSDLLGDTREVPPLWKNSVIPSGTTRERVSGSVAGRHIRGLGMAGHECVMWALADVASTVPFIPPVRRLLPSLSDVSIFLVCRPLAASATHQWPLLEDCHSNLRMFSLGSTTSQSLLLDLFSLFNPNPNDYDVNKRSFVLGDFTW